MIEHIISNLRQRDVELRLENGQLVCDSPRAAMTPELIEEDEQNKEAMVEYLKRTRGQEVSSFGNGTIPRASRDIEIPLSFSQESLWFLEQLNPGTSAYNIPVRINV